MAQSNEVHGRAPEDVRNSGDSAGSSPSVPTASSRLPLAIALLLFGLTVAAFLPSMKNGFIDVDDTGYISDNVHIKDGFSYSGVGWALTTSQGGAWHPLTWFSLMADCQLYGLRPAGHHFTDLLLHAVNSFLLFFLMLRLTGFMWRSLSVAGLFAFHPLHVESVAWASERKDTLSTVFWLLALLAYARYAESVKAQTPKSGRYYWASWLLFFGGLMSKPMLVTLPLVLLLLDWWPLGRLRLPLKTPANWPLILEKWPFFALACVISVITFFSQQEAGAVSSLSDLTLRDRLINASLSCWRYLGEMLWPLRLGAFYQLPQTAPVWQGLVAALGLIAASALFFLLRRARPECAFGWAWYLLTLAPVVGLVQVGHQSHADRYTYVPLIGIFVACVWSVVALSVNWPFRRVILSSAGAAILAACLWLDHRQLGYWKDSETLFRRSLEIDENNEFALEALGITYVRQGRLDEGIPHLRASVKLAPSFARAHNDLGAALGQKGLEDEAFNEFLEAIRLKPRFAEAHRNLALALERKGYANEAISHLQEAVTIDPKFPEAQRNLGVILGKRGWLDEAIEHLDKAIQLSPSDAEAHCSLGITLGRRGRLDEAIRELRRAVELDPNNSEAQCNLGVALGAKGDLDGAITHLQAAIKLKPDYPDAKNNLKLALERKSSPSTAAAPDPTP